MDEEEEETCIYSLAIYIAAGRILLGEDFG